MGGIEETISDFQMSLDALSIFEKLDSVSPTSRALLEFYQAIGPDMRRDLVPIAVAAENPALNPDGRELSPVLRFNYDEGHAGRLAAFDPNGGSVSLDWVKQREPDVWPFIKTNLVAGDFDNGENCVFCPGLNTFHEPTPEETSAPNRLVHYCKVLSGTQIAHMHTGTSLDQGDFTIDVSNSFVLRNVFPQVAPVLGSAGLAPSNSDNQLTWNCRQIDRLQAALSSQNVIDTPLKQALLSLLSTTSDESAAPFVIFGYSRGALELAAAIRLYLHRSEASEGSRDAAEARLRERVTVVTIGNATRWWADGPAYVHVAAWKDPLTSARGVHGDARRGGGSDAVYLNCDSPYHEEAFDNHNFGALTAQYLAVVMRANGVVGFRELWEKGHAGALEVPENVDQLTRAMIQVTRGYEWLWRPESAWRDIPHGALPEHDEAVELLRSALGVEWADALVERFAS